MPSGRDISLGLVSSFAAGSFQRRMPRRLALKMPLSTVKVLIMDIARMQRSTYVDHI